MKKDKYKIRLRIIKLHTLPPKWYKERALAQKGGDDGNYLKYNLMIKKAEKELQDLHDNF
jgi:hypothetical protein